MFAILFLTNNCPHSKRHLGKFKISFQWIMEQAAKLLTNSFHPHYLGLPFSASLAGIAYLCAYSSSHITLTALCVSVAHVIYTRSHSIIAFIIIAIINNNNGKRYRGNNCATWTIRRTVAGSESAFPSLLPFSPNAICPRTARPEKERFLTSPRYYLADVILTPHHFLSSTATRSDRIYICLLHAS